eukprot:scaffold4380_cov181-Ochromonas_danica.AAC.2
MDAALTHTPTAAISLQRSCGSRAKAKEKVCEELRQEGLLCPQQLIITSMTSSLGSCGRGGGGGGGTGGNGLDDSGGGGSG